MQLFFWPLVTVRWLHLSSLLALFGSALFAIYGRSPGSDRHGITCRVAVGGIGVGLAAAALASGICWVGLSLLDASEDLASLVSPAWWQTYLIETGFGRIWMLRLAGLVALLLCCYGSPRSQGAPAGLIAGLSAGLIASLAWLGHAVADRGPQLQTTYGNVLLCKIVLFAVLLALAAANRFVFLARLRRPGGSTSLHALSRSVLLEQLIGINIVALAAVLSSLAPVP